ncbi:hypothetical protein PV08_02918 [Exophiala spinifera]|uniref:Uncharacterized protein n=1 Tax=Exophiala spinifera TaxID=91928 RepID=A0A0D2C4W6_9EURO|nr:uncharacterized protein PV08_02918 [Exophiala spinifera]KIW18629.1 hypothetical protein PV08_02918 [Exophiala spinifera]
MLLLHALFHAGLWALVTPVSAQLPYNPTRIIPTKNGDLAYIFTPQSSSSSQFSLYSINVSHGFNSTSTKDTLTENLPFLSGTASEAFIAIPDEEGITVLAGDCNNSTQEIGLWRLETKDGETNSTWLHYPLSTNDTSVRLRYLSAGFSFSPTDSSDDVSLYVFGGMCPKTSTPNSADWVSDATYSNTMLTLAPSSGSSSISPYQLSLTGARAPPIAEAGLTITPLTPVFSNTSDTSVSQQQNVVLLGGHTQTAFINMSQLAIFSLPQESWAFVGASQPQDGTTVEPRSGHSAVLTSDGSRILVVGGWVGDVSTPAQPQLVVLEVGQGYGGEGNWEWTAPSASSSPFSAESGVYGHGAALLPGDVMVIYGGYSIGKSSTRRRDGVVGDILFLNITTMSWSSTYTNPYPSGSPTAVAGSSASSSGLRPAEKAGLGAGLGLGIAAAAGVAIVWLLYSRKLQKKRAIREKELREQALGSRSRFQTPSPPPDHDLDAPNFRSASWGALQEKHIESSGNPYPWAPVNAPGEPGRLEIPRDEDGNYAKLAERTGVLMEVPSPTRGLRRSLSNRVSMSFGPFNQHPPTGVPDSMFRIDEEDEGSQSGSSRRIKGLHGNLDGNSIKSDPFKDPTTAVEDPAARRKKEVEGWVEDWQSAAESFSVSRSTSQAYSRTHSNLSSFPPLTTGGDVSRQGSPEKSDRTGSNLSESSAFTSSSIQRSMTGTISRNVSQRSVSAGYALFAGAAAAMSRFGGGRGAQNETTNNGGLSRAPSNRSVSLNTDSNGRPNARDNADKYAFARGNPWAPVPLGESQGLLKTRGQPQDNRSYRTLPESTLADRYANASSLSGTTRRAMNLLGSMRRVFTGTGNVDVHERVGALEARSTQSSPTKRPEIIDLAPSRALSVGASSFWRGKRGAKDWDEDLPARGEAGPSSTHRKPLPGQAVDENDEELGDEDDDWDVETAVQKRVVQVMFTVPKEKLRVVNADALSLLSSNRSEADHEEDRERENIKRMSSVREGDNEDYEPDDSTTQMKGKEREH